MRTIKPVSDRILVGPDRSVQRHHGKIEIPNTAKWQGEGDHVFWVIAVGPKVTDIKPGDRVICPFDHAGLVPVHADDPQKRGFIRQEQVIALMREGA